MKDHAMIFRQQQTLGYSCMPKKCNLWKDGFLIQTTRVIQQLEQRKRPKLKFEVNVVGERQNRLARFLAENGALIRIGWLSFSGGIHGK